MLLLSNWFIGVDPGNTGSICFLEPVRSIISFIDLKLKAQDQREDLYTKMRSFKPIVKILVEDVHSIYGSSARSTFGFGYALGRVHFLLESLALEYGVIAPKDWQNMLEIKDKDPKVRKQLVADKMLGIYPRAQLHGPRGGLLTGRSDSLAIAYVAYLISKEENANNN